MSSLVAEKETYKEERNELHVLEEDEGDFYYDVKVKHVMKREIWKNKGVTMGNVTEGVEETSEKNQKLG